MTVFKTSVLALWLALSGTPAAFSQGAAQYPAKPIRIVVPNPAGGGIDVLSRVIGERLSHSLGQPVLVDNRPGAGTLLAAEFVARAPADGYTFMVTTDSTLTINPHLYTKLPYDPVVNADVKLTQGTDSD